MDDQRFDQLTRWFAGRRSRRHLLTSAVAAIGATVLTTVDRPDSGIARGRDCSDQSDGATCGRCGVCQANVCVPNSDSCGLCAACDAKTFTCKPANDGSTCSSCGVCKRGSCLPDSSLCSSKCEQCKRSGDGVPICLPRSRCKQGQSCCPVDGSCVPPDACCPGEHRCSDGDCCKETETCTQDGCCGSDPLDVICEGADGKKDCCHGGRCCFTPDGVSFCCAQTETCCGQANCCGDGLVCCDGDCKPPEECCDCGPCERCNRDVPDRPICEPTNEGVTCGDGGCGSLCKDGACTPVKSGETCLNGKPCCGFTCCDIPCLPDGTCCGQSSPGKSLAGQASLCCPFGAPCGVPGLEKCCAQGETCTSAGECCPAAKTCGDFCCGAGQSCCGSICCDDGALCCPDQLDGFGVCYVQEGAHTCCGYNVVCGTGAEVCCLTDVVVNGAQCFPAECPDGFYPQ